MTSMTTKDTAMTLLERVEGQIILCRPNCIDESGGMWPEMLKLWSQQSARGKRNARP